MITSFRFKDLFKKEVKSICIALGGFYSAFGLLALLMIKMQKLMIGSFEPIPDDSFQNTMNLLHRIWGSYMPFLILIGICYLLFGLFYNKIKANKYQINLVLSIISLIWVIAYSISSIKYVDVFLKTGEKDFEFFKYIGYIFVAFGFLAVLIVFTVPQYKIGKKIKEKEKLQNI